ncbi:MAG: aspartate carbamoyltransferase catalytic subunit [Desulfobacterales bacterium]|nr:aspartate carbamoyltransferase catalytic subunit [Desulfobacterales bacterium]MBF0397401.1 aspartate carbamoyltransferase catalytic subunit [Desulfobacterales bacterium]
MQFNKKDILDMESLSFDEIQFILDTADKMKEISQRPIKKVPTLRGKTIIHFFYEASTRTKTSFDIAAKRLSADCFSLSATTSSVVKGETLIDTAKNLDAMNSDVIIIRHSASGAPHLIAKNVKASIINAGDGMHEHPTQALLDLMTVREKKGKIETLKLAIIGDISHSRVARSNIIGFKKLGAEVKVSGPPAMIPKGIESLGATYTFDMSEAISDADIIMMLRIQKERLSDFSYPSDREYSRLYGLSMDKLKYTKKDVLIMHPGPVNRGLEISPEIADSDSSVILDQVENGVAVRMALLYLVAGGVRNVDSN